jgi:hypothetical protein
VLYGNKDQGFFGSKNSEIDPILIPAVEKQDGSLQLQAGRAQGVCDGDQFTLYQFRSIEDDFKSEDLVVTKVTRAGALTSDLERLSISSAHVRTEWMAKARTRHSLQRFRIRLASELQYQDILLAALKKRFLNAYNHMDEHPFSFHVVLNSERKYEILDESNQKLINLPIMPQDQTDVGYICNIIEHLARFKLLRNLANHELTDPFRESFSVKITSCSGKIYNPGSLVEV